MNHSEKVLQPKVTFIMPAYNAGRYIADSIQSIINQTEPDWELVVVNDCSTDNTLEIANEASLNDRRIRVFSMKCNSGNAFPPRLRAIELSASNLIAPLDADDIIENNYLEKLLREKEESGAEVIFPTMFRMSEKGIPGQRLTPHETFDISSTYNGMELVKHTLNCWEIGANGGILDKSLYLKCISEVEDTSLMNSDEYLTRIILINTRRLKISDAKYYYRDNSASITHRASTKLFDPLKTNDLLCELVSRHFHNHSEEMYRAEIQRFCGLVDAMKLYNSIGSRLSSDSRAAVMAQMRKSYKKIDWPTIGKHKKGKLYFLFRAGLKPASIFLKGYERIFKR